jgi:hypothetical protein
MDAPWWKVHPADPTPKQRVFTPARYFARQIVAENPKLNDRRDLLSVAVAEKLFEHGIGPRGDSNERYDALTIKNAFSKVDLLKPYPSA